MPRLQLAREISLGFFNKPGEPEEERTVLHAELLTTGTITSVAEQRALKR